MKRNRTNVWASAVLVAGMLYGTGPAMAEEPAPARKPATTAIDGQAKEALSGHHLIRANVFIGMDVVNAKGESIGDVHEIILDDSREFASYAVLSFGGWANIGDKLFAVPLSAFGYDASKNKLTLNVQKETLESLKGIDTERYPERPQQPIADPAQANRPSQADRDRESRPKDPAIARAEKPDTHWSQNQRTYALRSANKIVGANVYAETGKEEFLGDVEDLVIEQSSGRVVYALVAYGGALGVGEKTAVIPWSALKPDVSKNRYHLNATRTKLDQLAFSGDKQLKFDDQEFLRKVHEQFSIQPYWEVYGVPRTEIDAGQGWGREDRFAKAYDKSQEVQIRGTVVSIGTFHPASESAPGMRLRVRTEDSNMVTVQVGPYYYVLDQNCTIAHGDELVISGAKTSIDGQSVLIAREIKVGDKVLELRDQKGAPKWNNSNVPSQERYEYFRGVHRLDLPADDSRKDPSSRDTP